MASQVTEDRPVSLTLASGADSVLSPTDASKPGPAFWMLALSIILVAACLRLYRLGSQPLWLDEALSWYRAVTPGGLGAGTVIDYSPPLYYAGLSVWIGLFGQSETALRAPSAICGILFVGTILWAGRVMFSPRVGLWCGAIAASSPVHVFYSQEARPYAFLLFLILFIATGLWRTLCRDPWSRWFLVGMAATAALFTHYFAIMALVPMGLFILVVASRMGKTNLLKHLALVAGICMLILSPWYLIAIPLLLNYLGGADWVIALWRLIGPHWVPLYSLDMLALGGEAGTPASVALQHLWNSTPMLPGLHALGVVCVVGVAFWFSLPYGDRQIGVPNMVLRKAWLWILAGGPLLLLWSASWVQPMYLIGRYDVVALPGVLLLLGAGLAKIHGHRMIGAWLAGLLALAILVVTTSRTAAYLTAPSTHLSQNTAELLDDVVADGDAVVFTNLTALPVVYYLSRRGYVWRSGSCAKPVTGRQFACPTFPLETLRAPATYVASRVVHSQEEVQKDAGLIVASLNSVHSRIWIVVGGPWAMERSDTTLSEPDLSFVKALQKLGFTLSAMNSTNTFGILVFQRGA